MSRLEQKQQSFSHRQTLLEDTFRVWVRRQVADYRVTLTPESILLSSVHCHQQLEGRRRSNHLGNGCCCASLISMKTHAASIEIMGNEVVSCRPATALAANTKYDMGPPLMMLIAYTGVKSERTVLYFHWTGEVTGGRNSETSSDVSEDELEARTLLQVIEAKDRWVSAIHTMFFPSTSCITLPSKLGVSLLGLKLLVVLNPAAGADGTALRTFREKVVPVLRDAGTKYEVLLTEGPAHARDLLVRENLARWRGALSIGGDGTAAELLCGLFARADWQDALAHLSVVAVPVDGASAAFAARCSSAAAPYAQDAATATIVAAAKGRWRTLDLIFAQTAESSRVAAAYISWEPIKGGIFGGDRRPPRRLRRLLQRQGQIMNGLLQVMTVKSSTALISYLPAECCKKARPAAAIKRVPVNFDEATTSIHGSNCNSSTPISRTRSKSRTCSTCSLTDRENTYGRNQHGQDHLTTSLSTNKTEDNDEEADSTEPLLPSIKMQQPPPPKYAYTSLLAEGQLYFRSWQELDDRLRRSGPFPLLEGPSLMRPQITGNNSNNFTSLDYQRKRPRPRFPSMPDLPEPLPNDAGWITEVGDFCAVHLLCGEFGSRGRRFAPAAETTNGALWLLLVRAGVVKRDLLRYLSSLDSKNNNGERQPAGVELLRVRGLRLSPLSPGETRWVVDGDTLQTGPGGTLQAFVMPGVARTAAAFHD